MMLSALLSLIFPRRTKRRKVVFAPATWRGTSAICGCCGCVNLSFDLADDSVVRLKLPRAEMVHVLETYAEFQAHPPRRARCQGCLDQPDNSSGSPIADVSTGAPVASNAPGAALLSKSSSAEAGE